MQHCNISMVKCSLGVFLVTNFFKGESFHGKYAVILGT